MSLHGPIMVNNVEVAYWSARRVQEGALGNTYNCTVDWTPEGFQHWTGKPLSGHAHRHTFTLEHRYEDGAVALAAKVLSECMAVPS